MPTGHPAGATIAEAEQDRHQGRLLLRPTSDGQGGHVQVRVGGLDGDLVSVRSGASRMDRTGTFTPYCDTAAVADVFMA